MFNVDRFVVDCRAAQLEDSTHKSVREVVTRAVSEPGAVLKGLGEPQRSGVQKFIIRLTSPFSMSSGGHE